MINTAETITFITEHGHKHTMLIDWQQHCFIGVMDFGLFVFMPFGDLESPDTRYPQAPDFIMPHQLVATEKVFGLLDEQTYISSGNQDGEIITLKEYRSLKR
jgi:hypothetical protein